MSLPILKIIWAKNDPSGAHWNHLHVEGIPRRTGTPPVNNPGMTPSVRAIYDALSDKFGTPAYLRGGDWNHMGWYNRRHIGGTTTWSQHAWANAIDIGPYYGVKEQQKFYDFLTGKDDMSLLSEQDQKDLLAMLKRMRDLGSNPAWVSGAIEHLRNHPSGGAGVDSVARDLANRAHQRLDGIRNVL